MNTDSHWSKANGELIEIEAEGMTQQDAPITSRCDLSSAKKTPEIVTSQDILEPSKQAVLKCKFSSLNFVKEFRRFLG